MAKIPYIIVSPVYRNFNAGVRVLYRLCHLLNKAGYESYMSDRGSYLDWITPTIYGDSEKKYNLIKQGAITVYPEIFTNNFLSSSRPVGYVLNPQITPPYDVKFYYHNNFANGIKPENVLTIDVVEKEFFNTDLVYNRDINTVWVGKGDGEKIGDIKANNLKQFTNEIPSTRKEVADWFKHSELFYTFDALTALISEARLCGCPAVFIPNKRYDEKAFEKLNKDMLLKGLAKNNSEEEIQKAKQEIPLFKNEYQEYYKNEANQLLTFIEITQKM